MDSDLSSTLISARTAATSQSIAIAVTKKAHAMQMQLIQMVDDTARAAPPPGQGRHVDKVA